MDTATSLNNLGMAYDSMGKYKEAITYYEKALKIDQRVFGTNHPTVATTLNNLGLALQALGQHAKAVELYQKALLIKTTVLQSAGDPNAVDAEMAAMLNNLGTACFTLGFWDKAVGYLARACVVARAQLGDAHPDTKLYTANWKGAHAKLFGKAKP